ncbi:MAG: TlyA family RNA methyltransferase [Chloroflexota bacterium]|nr:MAG: TlyA family RNA methyltransferase [Chloroflexota bacterium]
MNAPASARPRATSPRAHRVRLDQLVVDRGLAPTRARAQALILGGKVRTGTGDAGRLDRKAGDLVTSDIELAVLEPDPFVSRGGHKLVAALDAFGIDPRDAVCLDVGASTGGFTDVLLQRGARRVYALDVGRGQLAEALRRNPRVVSMERTNARSITAGTLPESVTLATIDVSFISLRLVLDPVRQAFGPAGGSVVALVKPQFEAGRGQVPGGVVRDHDVHRATVERVAVAASEGGLVPRDVIPSPILGPEGNREFLLHLEVPAASSAAVPRPVVPAELADRIAAATAGPRP